MDEAARTPETAWGVGEEYEAGLGERAGLGSHRPLRGTETMREQDGGRGRRRVGQVERGVEAHRRLALGRAGDHARTRVDVGRVHLVDNDESDQREDDDEGDAGESAA